MAASYSSPARAAVIHEWALYGQQIDDHIDVFLDTFKMDHAIDLSDRLDLEDCTITVSDVLLTKLQMANLNEKDERDILTLLQNLELGTSDDPGAIDVPYIARLCAQDWGLFHYVELNLARLEKVRGVRSGFGERDRIRAYLERLQEALEARPKTRAWRLVPRWRAPSLARHGRGAVVGSTLWAVTRVVVCDYGPRNPSGNARECDKDADHRGSLT